MRIRSMVVGETSAMYIFTLGSELETKTKHKPVYFICAQSTSLEDARICTFSKEPVLVMCIAAASHAPRGLVSYGYGIPRHFHIDSHIDQREGIRTLNPRKAKNASVKNRSCRRTSHNIAAAAARARSTGSLD